jgi:putative tryptophan/tyrosine transport system substrate-binding protein
MPVIGFLHSQSPDTAADLMRGFHRGLKESGYVEGENVTIAYRWADNQIDRLPALAAELVRQQVAVISTGSNPAAFAARRQPQPSPSSSASPKTRSSLVLSPASPGQAVT